ncbi:hypothetical protein GC167_00250 [bacterium]|nr:hypothetical protein [bacterium]
MEAPRLPSLFKNRRAKSFEFQPRYYSERKERLENLQKHYAEGKSSASFRPNFRAESRLRGAAERTGQIRLLIAVVLAVLIYAVMRSTTV